MTVKATKIRMKGFRCFSSDNFTEVPLQPLACFVGANGAGKTAVLAAAARMFGATREDRELRNTDFHVPKGKKLDDVKGQMELTIEMEFEVDEEDLKKGSKAPTFVKHYVVTKPGGTPTLRARLHAQLQNSGRPEDPIDSHIDWTKSTAPEVADDDLVRMNAEDRRAISVLYVPANRTMRDDVARSGALKRLLGSLDWSEEKRDEVRAASETLGGLFRNHPGVKTITSEVAKAWSAVHRKAIYSDVRLEPAGSTHAELVRGTRPWFGPSHEGGSHELDILSEGLRSMFYIASVAAATAIDRAAMENDWLAGRFDGELLSPPALTLVAFEEPENHLSPHYLGKVVELLRLTSSSPTGQVLLATHSTNILSRIHPEEIRAMRWEPATGSSECNVIQMPKKEEAIRFIRGAVQAFPELYYSDMVLLAEGDSELVTLPRFLSAVGASPDTRHVSIVPLGGGHVNHLWRLLRSIKIPYNTLIDLDQGRTTGGWRRMRYILKQLGAVSWGMQVRTSDGKNRALTDEDLAAMLDHKCGLDQDFLLAELESYGVFFSRPLDYDMMLMKAYPDAYKALAAGEDGPSEDAASSSTSRTLGDGPATQRDDSLSNIDYNWYRYRFLDDSKPTSHAVALARLTEEQLKAGQPELLTRLLSVLAATDVD